jgi:hypothetical protein
MMIDMVFMYSEPLVWKAALSSNTSYDAELQELRVKEEYEMIKKTI